MTSLRKGVVGHQNPEEFPLMDYRKIRNKEELVKHCTGAL